MFKWLVEEGEINRNPFERMRPPMVEETPVPVITKADLSSLIKSLAGTSFEDRRDTAIIGLVEKQVSFLSGLGSIGIALEGGLADARC